MRRTLDVVTTLYLVPEDLPELRFDPNRGWAAQGCRTRSKYVDLWRLGEGDYLGCFSTLPAKGACPYFAGISECARWPALSAFSRSDDWPTRDPASSRRAIADPDSGSLEIVDSDSNVILEHISLPLSAERGDVLDAFSVWGSERVIVVLERERSRSCGSLDADDCGDRDEPSYELWSWSEAEGVALVATLNWETADYGVDHERVLAWYIGPDRDWLFAALDNGSWAGEVAEFELGSSSSGLGSRWATETEAVELDPELRGRWLPGDPATWMTTAVGLRDETDYRAQWRAIHPGPELIVQSGSLVEAADKPTVLEWNPVAFEDGRLVHGWTLCWQDDDAWREGLPPTARDLGLGCMGERPTGACELLAVAPGGKQLLARCETGGWVGPRNDELGSKARSFAGPVVDFTWTRTGLIIETQAGLSRATPAGLEPIDAPAGSVIVHARRSQAAGLVVAEGDGAVLVLDPASGEQILKLGPLHPLDAAFDPRGERLAIATPDEVLIYSLARATPVLRWHADGVVGLAWTQDGEALMTGDSLLAPTRLWSLGRTPVELPVSFAHLDPDDYGWSFDPSWRWAASTDESFIRTLDFVQLTWQGRAVYTDTGWFDGPPEDLDDLRVVFTEHPQWGAYEFSELAQLARRRGLAGAFFAGQELDSPPTPEQPIARRARGSN